MPATTYNKGWSEGAWGYNGWGGIAPAYIVDGVAGTGAVGTVSFRVDDVVIPTGVQGTGAITAPTPLVVFTAIGVSAMGAVGTVNIFGWTVVNDYQDATWVEVDVAA